MRRGLCLSKHGPLRSPVSRRELAGEGRFRRHRISERPISIADEARRNDFDGRGSLSEAALTEFCEFFLRIAIDQVDFMESLVQPDRLRTRILLWTEEETRLGHLPAKSGSILEAVLYRGELPRGEAPTIVDPKPMCRFAPRCPVAVEASHCITPNLVEAEPGHWVRCHLYPGS